MNKATMTGGVWQSCVLTGWVWLAFMAWIPVAVAQDALVGEPFQYTVQPGNSLTRIGARFGIEPGVLARANGLKYDALLRPGQVLQIDNRHIIPERLEEGILINLPQRMLYYFQAGDRVAHYPVGLGRPDWPTPAGRFKVIDLQENKTWLVPKSIQEEMRREDEVVLTRVPPGPENPLGKHWMGLSIPGIGIHGTIAPASIYHFQSHGCIRLHPDDIAALFPQVTKDQPGKIIYAPVLLARLADGRIFIEVHRDIYKKGIATHRDALVLRESEARGSGCRECPPIKSVEHAAKAQGLVDMIDWRKVKDVIRLKEGLAREVGLRAPL